MINRREMVISILIQKLVELVGIFFQIPYKIHLLKGILALYNNKKRKIFPKK